MDDKLDKMENLTMNARKSLHKLIFVGITAILILSACQPAATQSPAQAAPTQAATAAPEVQPTQPAAETGSDLSFDFSAVASDATVDTVAAKPATAEAPYWEAAPEHRLITLQGYPVSDHLLKPQIFIYPAAGLASSNEHMGKAAVDLQALLQSQQPGERLPYLPIYNAQQVLHTQVQYIDFKNGRGVRYLTQFDQAPLPVNNNELIYTFQGITSDGKYYIAAVLPVTHPELPSGDLQDEQAKAMEDFPGYLAGMVTLLNEQPAAAFTPDLSKLDALIQSLEVK